MLALGAVVSLWPSDLPHPTEGADGARHRATDILSRPEFQPPPRTLLERLFDLLGGLLQRLLRFAPGEKGLVAWIVLLVGVALVGLVVFALVRVIQRDPLGRTGIRVDGAGRHPADWRADAARHEAGAEWRDALRCHWRALVADLAARGLVEEVPGRTTGEYRRLVASAMPSGARLFADATALFEGAWYAARDVGEAEVAEERRLGREVMAEASR